MSRFPEQADGANYGSDEAPLPYYRAARYREERLSGHAYARAQALIYRNDEADLSVYRFHDVRAWYVAVLGEEPVPALREQIGRILAHGEPIDLPRPLLQTLAARRAEAKKQGSWLERHYLP